jgi:hypothetical protein
LSIKRRVSGPLEPATAMNEPQGWPLTEENKKQNKVALSACATRPIIFVVDMFRQLLNTPRSQEGVFWVAKRKQQVRKKPGARPGGS